MLCVKCRRIAAQTPNYYITTITPSPFPCCLNYCYPAGLHGYRISHVPILWYRGASYSVTSHRPMRNISFRRLLACSFLTVILAWVSSLIFENLHELVESGCQNGSKAWTDPCII